MMVEERGCCMKVNIDDVMLAFDAANNDMGTEVFYIRKENIFIYSFMKTRKMLFLNKGSIIVNYPHHNNVKIILLKTALEY